MNELALSPQQGVMAHDHLAPHTTGRSKTPTPQRKRATISNMDAQRIEGKIDDMRESLHNMEVTLTKVGMSQENTVRDAAMRQAEIADLEKRLRHVEKGQAKLIAYAAGAAAAISALARVLLG